MSESEDSLLWVVDFTPPPFISSFGNFRWCNETSCTPLVIELDISAQEFPIVLRFPVLLLDEQ